jgi:hypothetical protein
MKDIMWVKILVVIFKIWLDTKFNCNDLKEISFPIL